MPIFQTSDSTNPARRVHFNKELNQYECIKEKVPTRPFYYLKAKKTIAKATPNTAIEVSERDCKNCPLREQCCGKALSTKEMNSIHKEHYDQMHQKLTQNARYAKQMVRVSKTVEPVIGHWSILPI
jgi:hypothetical protein